VLHGPEGARQFFVDLPSALRGEVSEEELLDLGDDVLWLGAGRFQGRRCDAGVSAHGALLWTVRDGSVVRFRFFQTKADALQALSSPG
jgi:ketosteroid isomerase-like protein